jgi:dolichol-phosphate mannosyltransferase
MLRAVRTANVDVVCQMDADFSHLPTDLPRLIEAARDADLVVGSRYVPEGHVENWPLHRLLLSKFANEYVRLLTRIPVRDITSGFRCWRRQTLLDIPLVDIQSDGYAFQVEMTWHAHRLRRRIIEVPITFVERRQGQSKLSGRVVAESAALPWRLLLRQP